MEAIADNRRMTVPTRRWFRYSLRTLLGVITLACVGLAWMNWPEATLLKLRTLLAEGQFEELDELLSDDTRWVAVLLTEADLEVAPSTPQDILLGRRRFETVVIERIDGQLFIDIRADRGAVFATRRWSSRGGLSQPLQITNHNWLARRLFRPNGWFAHAVARPRAEAELIEDLWQHSLGRVPSAVEGRLATEHFASQPDKRQAAEDVLWTLCNGKEFLFGRPLLED